MNEITTRELLQHTEFVRRVALCLCADEHGADDLVQETWVTALTRERPEGSRVRGWLAGVARNLARQGRRGSSRRDARERTAAAVEGQPSTSSVVERMETHRRVVSAVLELPASAREVIVLSYFDALPPRAIASRLGVPVETVRTRIKRARERLRERLADEYGSQHALLGALTEFARHGAPAAPAAASATMVAPGGKIALAGVLAAVAGWAVWPLLGGAAEDLAPSELRGTERVASLVNEPQATVRPHEVSAPVVGQGRSARFGLRESVEAAADAPSEASGARPYGSLVVLDVDGRELTGEEGQFLLRPMHPGDLNGADDADDATRQSALTVAFRAGRFSLEGVPPGIVQIERAATTSEGEPRPVVFQNAQFEYVLGEPLLLFGRYLPDATLRVVDAYSGAELEAVSVLPRAGHADQRHPGPYTAAALCSKDQPSPVRLPRNRLEQSYWVTARGYTWSHLMVDHDTGGERVVALEPAGRLGIYASGHDEELAIFLRVYDSTTGHVAASCPLDCSDAGATFQGFTGIATGEYFVCAELGALDEERKVLDEARAIVTQGRTTEVFLTPVSPPIPAAVEVRGTLVLPAGHEDLEVDLRILPADGVRLRRWDTQAIEYGRMEWADGSEGVLAWHAERLTPGRYLFLVRPIQYGVLVDVPSTSIDDVRIELPALHSVVVRAPDESTGAPVGGAVLRWTRDLPLDAGPDAWVHFDLDAEAGSATLLVPPGPIHVAAGELEPVVVERLR